MVTYIDNIDNVDIGDNGDNVGNDDNGDNNDNCDNGDSTGFDRTGAVSGGASWNWERYTLQNTFSFLFYSEKGIEI